MAAQVRGQSGHIIGVLGRPLNATGPAARSASFHPIPDDAVRCGVDQGHLGAYPAALQLAPQAGQAGRGAKSQDETPCSRLPCS